MKWTSRKLISAWALTVTATLLLINGNLADTLWVNLMMFVWGGYFVANAFDKRVG